VTANCGDWKLESVPRKKAVWLKQMKDLITLELGYRVAGHIYMTWDLMSRTPRLGQILLRSGRYPVVKFSKNCPDFKGNFRVRSSHGRAAWSRDNGYSRRGIFSSSVLQLYRTPYAVRSAFLAILHFLYSVLTMLNNLTSRDICKFF